jgi:hypothetical protein
MPRKSEATSSYQLLAAERNVERRPVRLPRLAVALDALQHFPFDGDAAVDGDLGVGINGVRRARCGPTQPKGGVVGC